jgi:CRP-like cAMP-binding protein
MKEGIAYCLSCCALFSSLGRTRIQETFSAVPYQVREYRRDQVLHRQEKPYTSLLVLLSGEVDTLMPGPGGRCLIVETLAAPEPLAAALLFARDTRLPVTVRAKTPARVLILPRKSLELIGRRHPEVLISLVRDSADKIIRLAAKLRFSQFTTIRQKIASYLLEEGGLQEGAGGETTAVTLPHSREELARLFGVTRPSVSRVFAQMRDHGLVAYRGKKVDIRDPEGLREILEPPAG